MSDMSLGGRLTLKCGNEGLILIQLNYTEKLIELNLVFYLKKIMRVKFGKRKNLTTAESELSVTYYK